MKSKVKEYSELFEKYSRTMHENDISQEPIQELQEEVNELKGKISKIDYNNSQIIADRMEKIVERNVLKREEEIKSVVETEFANWSNGSSQIKKNIDNVSKWINPDKCIEILKRTPANAVDNLDQTEIGNTNDLLVLYVVNWLFSHIFRMEFLKKRLKKASRILIGCIVWILIVIFTIPKMVYNKYNSNSIWHDFTPYQLEAYRTEFVNSAIRTTIVILLLILALNVFVILIAKFRAQKYLETHRTMCMAYFGDHTIKENMCVVKMNEFMSTDVARWKDQIKQIRNGQGPSASDDENMLYLHAKRELLPDYEKYSKQIASKQSKMEKIKRDSVNNKKDIDALVKELNNKASEVVGLVNDPNYNEGVLSRYVSTGFGKTVHNKVKELNVLKHDYKPLVISYSDEICRDSEFFGKHLANVIELLIYGFLRENDYRLIQMHFVDLETGGAAIEKQEIRKLLRIIKSQHELQQLYRELRDEREMVTKMGKIDVVNPERLKRREKPIKYQIVFFYGVDYNTMDKETNQLFISCENFGFLPVIFMKDDEMEKIAKSDSSAKCFSAVINSVYKNKNKYVFEEIINKIEYGLVVTNKDTPICAKKVMTYAEFIEHATSDVGLDLEGDLLIDVDDLDEALYDAIQETGIECYYFTSKNQNPSFIKEKIVAVNEL